MKYYIEKITHYSFDKAVERVNEELKKKVLSYFQKSISTKS
jgi:uncharacterized protein (DUF302 family)